ncbi:MAG: helix-turn-helix transcriptional regulator [Polyangia bacterium]
MYNHIASALTKTRINVLLERSGISRDELAKLTGASHKTLEAIESGHYDPPLSIAFKIAAALNVPIEHLYEDPVHQAK